MRRSMTGALLMGFLFALVVTPVADAAPRMAVIKVSGMTCDG